MSEIGSHIGAISQALGIDIGGTAIKAAVVNTAGELAEKFQAPSPRSILELRDFFHSTIEKASVPLSGVGIACKGIIDAESSRINRLPGDLNFLEGNVLGDLVGANLPVRADNDARAALVAEVLWGAARGRRNVVLLTLGTGVGGAAMVDGVILHGAAGIAGHFGHMTVDVHGPLCMCGNHGCLETRFSSRAIEADYFAHQHRAASTTLPREGGQFPDAEAIFRAAASGDLSAQSVLDRAFEYLGALVVSLLHAFDPEVLILGGNIAQAADQVLVPVRAAIAKNGCGMLGREVPVVLQSAVGYGGVLGAAGLVFLHQQILKV
ncbi:MAG TPA: ROK family protein [Terriglobales bacterium]|jgi:glucokinase|nr:ROK family protein [Terriglobales bacterium]